MSEEKENIEEKPEEAKEAEVVEQAEMSEDDAEKQLANTITPKEQAERNKSYAIFTTAIMQKLFADEYKKLNNATVPMTELPGLVTIVEQLKNNPNAMVRTSAIEALSYLQDADYKKDLTTVFTIAQKDIDKGVQEAAKEALAKLNNLENPQQAAQTINLSETVNPQRAAA